MNRYLANTLKLAVLIIALSTLSLAFRSEQYVVEKPLTEDGYYAFSIARNIALGKGLTADGLALTNGFQPLFTFLCVPAFILTKGDRIAGIRCIFLLHWLFYIGTAYLLGLIMRDVFSTKDQQQGNLAGWLTAFIYMAALFIFMGHFNGLETGCLLFSLALAFRYYQIGSLKNWQGLVMLGMILGFVVLARIDAVFLVIVISLYQFSANKQLKFLTRLGRSLAVGGVAFLISLPWWLYNSITFGNLLPTSGQALQYWAFSAVRLKEAVASFFQVAMPIIYTSHFDYILFDIIRLICLCFVVIISRKMFNKLKASRRTFEFGILLFSANIILILCYTFAFWSYFSYGRYFSPMLLLSTLILALFFLQIMPKIKKTAILLVIILSLPVLVAVFFAHTGMIFKGNTNYSEQLQLVREIVPDADFVAAGQSGTLGYFRERVVHLDGRVNAEALQFQDKMWLYLEKRKIRWFCDWPGYIDTYLGESPQTHGWKLVAKKGSFILYHRQ